MSITQMRRLARDSHRYILIPRLSLFMPLFVIWAACMLISLLPVIGYLMIIIPLVLLCIPVLISWYEVWASFGYSKKVYIALNIIVLIITRLIGMAVNGPLLELLLERRIIYGF